MALFADERMEVTAAQHLKGLKPSCVAVPSGTSAARAGVLREVVSVYNSAVAAAATSEEGQLTGEVVPPPATVVQLETAGFGKELAKGLEALERGLRRQEDKKKEWEKARTTPLVCVSRRSRSSRALY